MSGPLPVGEALARILARCRRLPAELVPLSEARGRVAAAEVRADLDLPPFDNSAMDGYAVRAAELAGASPDRPVIVPVQEGGAAGEDPPPLRPGWAAKCMTGAPFPPGADAVVPFERASVPEPGRVAFTQPVRAGANRRPRGGDIAQGEVVVPVGSSLKHAALALLAAAGSDPVPVARRPRVAVCSTGDELVDHRSRPGPGQVRDSSRLALPAQLVAAGAEVVLVAHAVDSPAALEAFLGQAAGAELILTAGGVSMGERDFVRPTFERLGEVDFWQVAIKPGKPLLFGRLGEALFFGLPGNPVSSMVCVDVFVRPAIDALLGRSDGGRLALRARLTAALTSDPGRAEYARCRAWSQADGGWQVTPTGDQSSGRMSNMLGANGYVVLPAGVGGAAAGDEVTVELYDPGPGAAA